MSSKVRLLVAMAALTLAFVSVVSASVGPLVLASGPSPFAACTIGGPRTRELRQRRGRAVGRRQPDEPEQQHRRLPAGPLERRRRARARRGGHT